MSYWPLGERAEARVRSGTTRLPGSEAPPHPLGGPPALRVREAPGFAAWGPWVAASCVRVRGEGGP